MLSLEEKSYRPKKIRVKIENKYLINQTKQYRMYHIIKLFSHPFSMTRCFVFLPNSAYAFSNCFLAGFSAVITLKLKVNKKMINPLG